MNEVLNKKIEELESANKFECWYLVKQATEFDKLCYLVSALEKYKNSGTSANLETFVSTEINKIMADKQNLDLSGTHRALRVAAFFGLIRMNSSRYEDADITETYIEIKNRCNGNYEETSKYTDIIVRQLEKMYISSEIDEESNGVRVQFRLFPVMLLYKVLIEIGKLTGDYSISTNEYRYFVATTKKYSDYFHTLFLINLLREEPSVNVNLDKYREKFDNRMIQALKQLNTILVDDSGIKLNTKYLSIVSRKVFIFELNPNIFYTDKYIDFLCSTCTLFELPEPRLAEEFYHGLNASIKPLSIDDNNKIKVGYNILFYGVPGVGKSYEIDRIKSGFSKHERTVFHPDYTNADFIGQILPQKEEGKPIDYKFIAGPFTRILSEAIKYIDDESKKYMLVVEEINRGNAAAIFGEIFQLLDRADDGFSKYAISNSDIAKCIKDNINDNAKWFEMWKKHYKKYLNNEDINENEMLDKVKDLVFIPNNLYIFATMNTSDQNIYTLDTAFQRRWTMEMLPIDYDSEDQAVNNQWNLQIDGSKNLKWKSFVKSINEEISNKMRDMISTEDKRIGTFFAVEREIKDKNLFVQKVIKYLWDDAFKLSKADGDIFNKDIESFDDIVKDVKSGKLSIEDIFDSNVKNLFEKNNKQEKAIDDLSNNE